MGESGAGGRQARAVREAAVARARPTSRRPSTPPSAPGGSSWRRSCGATTRPPRRSSRSCGRARSGELRVVRAAFGFTLDPGADNVRWSGELEGGALMDVGCYCVSALRLLAGEPERVSAELVEGGDGVDARLAGLLRFGGDVLGTFDCAFDVPVPGRHRGRGGDGHDRLARPVARPLARGADPARRTPSPRRSPSRPPTRTRASSTTSPARSARAASRGSAAPTPSARRARSRRCTARPREGGRRHRSELTLARHAAGCGGHCGRGRGRRRPAAAAPRAAAADDRAGRVAARLGGHARRDPGADVRPHRQHGRGRARRARRSSSRSSRWRCSAARWPTRSTAGG